MIDSNTMLNNELATAILAGIMLGALVVGTISAIHGSHRRKRSFYEAVKETYPSSSLLSGVELNNQYLSLRRFHIQNLVLHRITTIKNAARVDDSHASTITILDCDRARNRGVQQTLLCIFQLAYPSERIILLENRQSIIANDHRLAANFVHQHITETGTLHSFSLWLSHKNQERLIGEAEFCNLLVALSGSNCYVELMDDICLVSLSQNAIKGRYYFDASSVKGSEYVHLIGLASAVFRYFSAYVTN